jgi:hypothetical protein
MARMISGCEVDESRVGRCGLCFQTAPANSTISDVNLTSRQREALRKEKSAAKREKREARRREKANDASTASVKPAT